MSSLATLRFFTTPAHPCSYLEDRQATTLFVDPRARITPELYSELSQHGFRRSGEFIYRPHCVGCDACIPARIAVDEFHPRRRHQRTIRANNDLSVEQEPAAFSLEHYRLYARYIEARHADGDMFPPSEEQFCSFLMSDWSDTRFYSFRLDGHLIAVAVADQLNDGLSAVYTYFDPDLDRRSLGNRAILWQIDECRRLGLPYLYLGYWVPPCQKMAYKRDFQPFEILIDGVGQRYRPE